MLRVIVLGPGGIVDTLTPDQALESSPFAITAQTLQGKEPGDFVQTNATLTQTKMDQLAAGTSDLYVRSDGSNLTAPMSANNQRITSVAVPTTATDAVNKSYADTKLAGQTVDSTAPANGQVLVWDSSLSKWIASSPMDASVQAHARQSNPPCGVGQASKWDGSVWSCVAFGASGGGATAHSLLSGTVVLPSTGSKINSFEFTNGGMIQMPDATAMPTGGSHFTLFNATNETIPILDATGAFVAGLNGSNSTDVFLFSNATSAGIWRFNNASSPYGLESKSLDSSVTGNLNNLYWDQIPTTTKYIVVYAKNDPDNKVVAKIVDVDTSTKAVTWGATEVDVATATTNLEWVRSVSATKALAKVNGNIYLLSLDTVGNSVSVDSSIIANYCNNNGRVSNGNYYCWSDYELRKYTVSGSSVTESTLNVGSSINGFEVLDANYGIVLYNTYVTTTDVYARAVNISAAPTLAGSGPHLIGSFNDSINVTDTVWHKSTHPLSTTDALVLISKGYMSGGSVTYKLTLDGSYNVTHVTGPSFSGESRFELVDSNLYVFVNNMSASSKKLVSAPATMTMDAGESKSYSCPGLRYATSKCLWFESMYIDGANKPGVRFNIGY